jgi:hypothetical protein
MSLYHRFKDRFGTAGVVLGVIGGSCVGEAR